MEDMDIIHEETDFVTGISPAFGSSGNPSPATALGVYKGMKAAVRNTMVMILWKVRKLLFKAWEMLHTTYVTTSIKREQR